LLVSIFRETRPIHRDLWNNLILLHSYTLIKRLAMLDKHTTAALMLIRVTKALKLFPKHAVQLLVSGFIECSKADMKSEAYRFACELVKPEYRPQVPDSIRSKIEQMVRKPEKDVKPFYEQASPCPYCKTLVEDSLTECASCLNTLPICIFSGMHLTSLGISTCPSCNMGALVTEIPQEETFECLFCGRPSHHGELMIVTDPAKFFNEFKKLFAGKS